MVPLFFNRMVYFKVVRIQDTIESLQIISNVRIYAHIYARILRMSIFPNSVHFILQFVIGLLIPKFD